MLTAERLRELLDYDATSGMFRWRINRGNGAKAGDIFAKPETAAAVFAAAAEQHFAEYSRAA